MQRINCITCQKDTPCARPHGHNYIVKVELKSETLDATGFVKDYGELQSMYIKTGLISKNQVILMPEGATIAELQKNREKVVEICVENNVRYSTREHVVIWDKKTGV